MLHTHKVQTKLGVFQIAAIENAIGQKVWQVIEVPDTFKPAMIAAGLSIRDMQLNAVQGDEMARQAIVILNQMLPDCEIRERETSITSPKAKLNLAHFASKKHIAHVAKSEYHTDVRTGKRIRILRKNK